jgi:hypothetical protein
MSLDARQRCVFEAKLAEQAERYDGATTTRSRTIDDERSVASRLVFDADANEFARPDRGRTRTTTRTMDD